MRLEHVNATESTPRVPTRFESIAGGTVFRAMSVVASTADDGAGSSFPYSCRPGMLVHLMQTDPVYHASSDRRPATPKMRSEIMGHTAVFKEIGGSRERGIRKRSRRRILLRERAWSE